MTTIGRYEFLIDGSVSPEIATALEALGQATRRLEGDALPGDLGAPGRVILTADQRMVERLKASGQALPCIIYISNELASMTGHLIDRLGTLVEQPPDRIGTSSLILLLRGIDRLYPR